MQEVDGTQIKVDDIQTKGIVKALAKYEQQLHKFLLNQLHQIFHSFDSFSSHQDLSLPHLGHCAVMIWIYQSLQESVQLLRCPVNSSMSWHSKRTRKRQKLRGGEDKGLDLLTKSGDIWWETKWISKNRPFSSFLTTYVLLYSAKKGER